MEEMADPIEFSYYTEAGILNPEEEVYCIAYKTKNRFISFGEVTDVLSTFLEKHPEFEHVPIRSKTNQSPSSWDIVFEVYPDGKVFMVYY